MTDEREEAAKQIRRVRDAVADEPSEVRSAQEVLGEARTPRAPEAVPSLEIPAAPPVPAPPDGTDVNATWDIRRVLTSGGRLRRWLARLAAPLVETQTTFNARQVQFDNALMTFLVARLEAIHRQYDAVLGIHGRHMEDIDARHLQAAVGKGAGRRQSDVAKPQDTEGVETHRPSPADGHPLSHTRDALHSFVSAAPAPAGAGGPWIPDLSPADSRTRSFTWASRRSSSCSACSCCAPLSPAWRGTCATRSA